LNHSANGSSFVDDQHVDGGQPADFGFEGVVEAAARSRVNSLSARVNSTV
jgi:hypothetical protein